MDKLALMLVGVFAIAGIHTALNGQSNVLEAEHRQAEDAYEILARNASLAGLSRVKQMLADDFRGYNEITGTNDGVGYTVNADVTGNTVVVHSVGRAYNSNGKPVPFNVQVKLKRKIILPSQAPENMRYAVISDENLLVRGGIDGDVYADGEAGNELNANFHTNASLQANGRASSIKGFGTFVLTASPSTSRLADIFVPNHNPSGADHCFQTATVSIDALDLTSLVALASPDSVTAGNVELSGTLDTGGTREDPYVWHIQGDLEFKGGGTTINGYAMLIVDGEVDIRGNARVGSTGYDGGDESSVALYTGGGVRMRGNSELWGQIYSNGGVEFASGNPEVYGSITTKGAVDFRGNVHIYYRKASPALTRPFQPDVDVLERLAYSEW